MFNARAMDHLIKGYEPTKASMIPQYTINEECQVAFTMVPRANSSSDKNKNLSKMNSQFSDSKSFNSDKEQFEAFDE